MTSLAEKPVNLAKEVTVSALLVLFLFCEKRVGSGLIADADIDDCAPHLLMDLDGPAMS
jgi:hypothetical protein